MFLICPLSSPSSSSVINNVAYPIPLFSVILYVLSSSSDCCPLLLRLIIPCFCASNISCLQLCYHPAPFLSFISSRGLIIYHFTCFLFLSFPLLKRFFVIETLRASTMRRGFCNQFYVVSRCVPCQSQPSLHLKVRGESPQR